MGKETWLKSDHRRTGHDGRVTVDCPLCVKEANEALERAADRDTAGLAY